MFEKFKNKFFFATEQNHKNTPSESNNILPPELIPLIDLFGGNTLNKGVYRLHSVTSCIKWAIIITEYFDDFKKEIYPFGFDWMGRQFCIKKGHQGLILMFDPATGEYFELEQDIVSFHNYDLVDDTDNILSEDVFREVCVLNKIDNLRYYECLSHKMPLFLGGEDKLENYVKSNLEVYWEMQNQICKQIKNLPDGTKINSIKIE